MSLHRPLPPRPTLQANRAGADTTSVTRTLRPGQPGTKSLMARYGEALLCVRYRHDRAGLRRYTTVELVVSSGPVQNHRARTASFPVLVEPGETTVRTAIRAAGGVWDRHLGLWYLKGTAIQRLGLAHRVWLVPPERRSSTEKTESRDHDIRLA